MTPLFLGRSFKERPFFFVCLSAVFVFLLASFACSRNDASQNAIEEDQQTLFTVNDIEVSSYEFNQAYLRYIIKNGRNDTKDERYRFLARWKENLLLAEEAIDNGYTKNPIYIEATEAQKRKTIADIYFVKEMNELLPEITDDELRLAFAKSKRKVYPRQLYATTKEALVPYYQKLEEGANFIKLANEFYQTASYDSLAGSLGSIGYYSVDDAFAEKAFSLNKEEYSEPFQSKLGWHIIWVEHIIFEAMLAEDEYQIKKEGTFSKYRSRKANLYAGDYIKDQMQKLEVLPNKEGILSLKTQLEKVAANQETQSSLEQIPQTTNPEFWESDAISEIADEFDKNMSLATYKFNGEILTFTVADYLSWLPYLSANESKARTGASLGRAIRNEYFYKKGIESGTDESFEVQRIVRNRGLDVLSQLYQKEIINQALQDTTAVEIPTWFVDRLFPNQGYKMNASYSFVKATDSDNAVALRKKWEQEKSNRSIKGLSKLNNQQMDANTPLFVLISKALINKPMVANSKEYGWIVLNVEKREFLPFKSQTMIASENVLQQQYRAYSALKDSLTKYDAQSKVQIDTTVFNRMYLLQ